MFPFMGEIFKNRHSISSFLCHKFYKDRKSTLYTAFNFLSLIFFKSSNLKNLKKDFSGQIFWELENPAQWEISVIR